MIGPTGSGKSTLLDLLMGLLQPDSGMNLVDDVPLDPAVQRAWQRSIAHVPQSIFLAIRPFSKHRAEPARRAEDPSASSTPPAKAQLHDFIMSLPGGLRDLVGERGIASPAGSGSGWGSRAQSTRTPRFSSSTKRPAPWTSLPKTVSWPRSTR